MAKPTANGTNGRKSNGQFAKGNPGGTGNQENGDAQKERAAKCAAFDNETAQVEYLLEIFDRLSQKQQSEFLQAIQNKG